jgi:glycosyltransferase involved in cell wall biosynthesis
MRNKNRKLKIIDWLVHGGHQYEFFKIDQRFFCTNPDGTTPRYENLGRPRNKNVNYISGKRALVDYFDIVMVRAGVDYGIYKKVRYGKGRLPPGIAVMQTYIPYEIPRWVSCVVWNSKAVMDKHYKSFSNKKHFYIPHGFDPREFSFLNLKRNDRALSAASLFRQRQKVLGFNEWQWVSDKLGKCDLLGHGNDGLKEVIGSFPLEKLVRTYNKYGVFLNTTTKSAMPRTRSEALMCGTPLVTTNNFGIDKYLVNNKSCIFADTKEDMLKAVKKILESKQMQDDLSQEGRAAAIKHFHIHDYKKRWEHVFEEARL